MALSMLQSSIPVFIRTLTSLKAILEKGAAQGLLIPAHHLLCGADHRPAIVERSSWRAGQTAVGHALHVFLSEIGAFGAHLQDTRIVAVSSGG